MLLSSQPIFFRSMSSKLFMGFSRENYGACIPRLTSRFRFTLLVCLSSLFLNGLKAYAQSWSPDGKMIAIGGPSLQLLDARELNAASLSPSLPVIFTQSGSGTASAPVWSRDGRTLAYIADGPKLTMLEMKDKRSKILDANVVSPVAWSRDSALFAVVHQNEKGGLQALIRYRNGQTFLPPINLPFRSVPSIFPAVRFLTNTTNVIVAGGDGGKNDLHLLDEGEVVRLTTTGDVLGYAVSSDGTRLRWVRASPNTHHILLQIYEMNIDTRSLRKLPFPDRLPAVNPDPRNSPNSLAGVVFAPDMNSFVFIARGGPQTVGNGSGLWISDITGKEVHFVGSGVSIPGMSGSATGSTGAATTPTLTSFTAATGLTFPALPPTFSPDGRTLTALRAENGKRSLFVANAATGQGKDIPLQ